MSDEEHQTQVPAHGEHTSEPQTSNGNESISISFTHHGTTHTFDFAPDATISDLSSRIVTDLHIPESNQKFMITPKTGLLKPPFPSSSSGPAPPLLQSLQSKKIVLLAPTPADLASLSRLTRPPPSSSSSTALRPGTPTRHRDWQKAQDEATYTFSTIIPLSYLPNPSRSQQYLERLRDDPGIKASMRKHRFRVGVLTEMDPAAHTTHESRTLGLNRNRGEVIELRLRTDAYDGYRDYKIIRDTLCHELAHNVFGEHDKHFWALCRQIEGEVRVNGWKSGGNSVGNQVYYDPAEHQGEHVDAGGWTGGEYVLGRGGGQSGSSAAAASGAGGGSGSGGGAIDRREAMARAAEERARKQKELGQGKGT